MLARSLRTAAIVVAWLPLGAAAPPPDAAAAFTQLKALVGTWRGPSPSGRVLDVSYHLVANGTVLVETWTLAPGRQSLTLYHLDGDRLMATHYCPIGNQPRLALRQRTAEGRYVFEFVDATNLRDLDQAHQHAFWIELRGTGALARSETYREKGVDEAETVIFERITPAAR